MYPLILASSSVYRRAMLERLGIEFDVQAPSVDERLLPDEPPPEAVVRIATAKAKAVGAGRARALVIGSDQLAALDGEVLGKPGSTERALEQLTRARGREVEFFTGVALLDTGSGETRTRVAINRVKFRNLSSAQIGAYVRRDKPLDCAGSFKSEGLGVALFEAIEGTDPYALVGLPLIALCDLLAEAGVDVLVRSG